LWSHCKAPTPSVDLWTPYLFRTCQKVLRPGCEFEPLFEIAAPSDF
jgi:hypothetical protein